MIEILAVRYGVSISKKDIRKTLINIDPEGVTIRRIKVIRRIYLKGRNFRGKKFSRILRMAFQSAKINSREIKKIP